MRPTRKPETGSLLTSEDAVFSYLVLLLMGFTEPRISRPALVRSYRTVSPLPAPRERDVGGLLSVALSVGLPRLAVNQHGALWSSDFPPFPREAETATSRKSRPLILIQGQPKQKTGDCRPKVFDLTCRYALSLTQDHGHCSAAGRRGSNVRKCLRKALSPIPRSLYNNAAVPRQGAPLTIDPQRPSYMEIRL